MSAVDRVSTIASERGRAVKLNLAKSKLVLSVNNPEGGSATEEIDVNYTSARSRSASTPSTCSTSPVSSKARTRASCSPIPARRP